LADQGASRYVGTEAIDLWGKIRQLVEHFGGQNVLWMDAQRLFGHFLGISGICSGSLYLTSKKRSHTVSKPLRNLLVSRKIEKTKVIRNKRAESIVSRVNKGKP
jgi:hypothetical protein